MASAKVRAASIFVGGRKVGQFVSSKYTISAGDELQYGDPGVIGFSDGAITTTLSATGIVPVAGQDVALENALVNHNDIDVAVALINGKIHQISMRVNKAEYDSDHKTGILTGQFELIGTEPKIT
jgi:hypothetical protein